MACLNPLLPGAADELERLAVDQGFCAIKIPQAHYEFWAIDHRAQPDLGVLVALTDDPTVALLDVGWTPRSVQMVQRHRAGLHVRPNPHLLRRPHEHGDPATSSGGEQPRLLGIVLGLMDEPASAPTRAGRVAKGCSWARG